MWVVYKVSELAPESWQTKIHLLIRRICAHVRYRNLRRAFSFNVAGTSIPTRYYQNNHSLFKLYVQNAPQEISVIFRKTVKCDVRQF